MLNQKWSALQEGCMSTQETCPYRTSFSFSRFVMERTSCWHHIELGIFWGMKCRERKTHNTSRGIHISVKHTAGWRFSEQELFEQDLRCRRTPPPSGWKKILYLNTHNVHKTFTLAHNVNVPGIAIEPPKHNWSGVYYVYVAWIVMHVSNAI